MTSFSQIARVLASGFIFCLLLAASPVTAQTQQQATQQQASPSQVSLQHAKLISNACPGQWATPPCLRTVSESTMVFASNYAATLQNLNRPGAVNAIKEHCAAATAAAKTDIPAYAMKSALTECANIVPEVAKQTNVLPDQSHYQLLIAPVLCLSEDKARECSFLEKEMIRLYAD